MQPVVGINEQQSDENMLLKSLVTSNRKCGRLSLKRKEELEEQNAEMFPDAASSQSLAQNGNGINKNKDTLPVVLVAPSIANLGNTCFLNSVIQVLFYTPTFLDNITALNNEIKSTEKDLVTLAEFDVKFDEMISCSHSWKLVHSLCKLLEAMKKIEVRIADDDCKSLSPISPFDLLETLQTISSMFAGRQQQDAHEFLRFILGMIQNAIQELNDCRQNIQLVQHTFKVRQSTYICHHQVTTKNSNCQHLQSNGSLKALKDSVLVQSKINFQLEKHNYVDNINEVQMSSCLEGKGRGDGQLPLCDRQPPKKRSKVKHNELLPIIEVSADKKSTMPVVASGLLQQDCALTLSNVGSEFENSAVKERQKGAPVPSIGHTKTPISSYFNPVVKPELVVEIVFQTDTVPDFVEAICQGNMKQLTRCLECELVTSRKEDFQDLSLPVKKVVDEKGQSDEESESVVEDKGYSWILKVIDEVEKLQSENKFWCDICNHHVEAECSVQYINVPNVLMIQLKRFSAFSGLFGGFSKTMDCVSVAMYLPCLEHSCRTSRNENHHRYELYAVLSHSGISLSSGHYITYVKAPAGCSSKIKSVSESSCTCRKNSTGSLIAETSEICSIWYKCDDESVTVLSQCCFEALLSAGSATTPYILFYRKCF